MIQILIVSELGLLRGALQAVLSRENDFSVTELDPRQDPVATSRRLRPDVVVLDLVPDDRAGLATAHRLHQALPGCKLIALTESPTAGGLRQALDAGVRGFTGTNGRPEELVELIRKVAGGARVIDTGAARAALATVDNPLSARERDVLRLAAEGLPTKAIARKLFLTDGTVRNHVWAILRKTGTHNRMQAIRRAQDAGWI